MQAPILIFSCAGSNVRLSVQSLFEEMGKTWSMAPSGLSLYFISQHVDGTHFHTAQLFLFFLLLNSVSLSIRSVTYLVSVLYFLF